MISTATIIIDTVVRIKSYRHDIIGTNTGA